MYFSQLKGVDALSILNFPDRRTCTLLIIGSIKNSDNKYWDKIL